MGIEKGEPAKTGEGRTGEVTASGDALKPHIVAAGFPNRTRLILDHEEKMFFSWLQEIARPNPEKPSKAEPGKKKKEAGKPSLYLADLQTAFASSKPGPLIAATFVGGRSLSANPAENAQIKQLLQTLVEKVPPGKYGVMGQPVIEAVFSLGLLGEKDFAAEKLHSLLEVKFPTFEAYLAAFYLAQMGDLSGYPVMQRSLNSEMIHTRLMATRYLFGFKPFDGEKISDLKVDLKAAYLERLKDDSNYVSREVPFLLIQAEIPGVKKILTDSLPHITDEETREAIEDALDRLKNNRQSGSL